MCGFFIIVFGINCYKCGSYRSQEDCSNNRKEIECLLNNYCVIQIEEYKFVSGYEYNYYQRDCIFYLYCNGLGIFKLKVCMEVKGMECLFKCCFMDFCNGSKVVLMISIFLMLICVFIGFIY